MANIIKKADRGISVTERCQSFTHVDGGTGDVIKVSESLGKPGTHIVIETAGTLNIRFNVQRTIFPERTHAEYDSMYPGEYKNLARGIDIEDETGAIVSLTAGDTFTLDNDLPVKDIKLLLATGNFNIFVC